MYLNSIIPLDLASDYLAGAVLLGAAPCTAMVFVWSHLTKGDPAYTLVQVAVNDLILLVAFTPIVAFLLGISNVVVPYDTFVFISYTFCCNSTGWWVLNKKKCSRKAWVGLF